MPVHSQGSWKSKSPILLNSKEKPALATAAHWSATVNPKWVRLYILSASRSFQPTVPDRPRFSKADASCKATGCVSVPLHKSGGMPECQPATPVKAGVLFVFNFNIHT